MGGITDAITGGGGDDAADASRDASKTQAKYQREALDYLKKKEKLPSAYREGALRTLGQEYGLDSQGRPIDDGMSLIERAEASPFYETAVARGEEGALRYASMHGGLRSGGIKETLAEVNQNALQQAYNQQIQGLQGLAQQPSLAIPISQGMSGIGQTLAQGMIGGAQAQQAGQQQGMGNMMGMAQLGMQAYGQFSDVRLKDNITRVGHENGHNVYVWVWNDKAKALGLEGRAQGVLADEVEKYAPDVVGEHKGYKTVDYDQLGVSHYAV